MDGFPTILDQYVEHGGGPPESWPRWMLNAMHNATYVLCVCTETYERRFLGREIPERGKGADWEGALITQALYESRNHSNKFIAVLLTADAQRYIPAPLRPRTHYTVDSDEGYRQLVAALQGRCTESAAPTASAASRPTTAAPSSRALGIWQEKLEFLLVEEAVCVDPAMRFRLRHLIAEAQERIKELT
jgi:hypothetical protein